MTTSQKFNNDYFEKCLLGIMLLDNNQIDMISGRTSKECFYNPLNRRIYEKICMQWNKNKKADIVTVSENEDGKTAGYIAELTNCVSSSTDWEVYVNNLNNLATTRTAPKEISRILETINPDNLTEKFGELQTKISQYAIKKNNGYTMKELAIENATQVDNASRTEDMFTGFETGFENLDSIIDGWQEDTMYVIGARPSIGKTAFALAIIKGLAMHQTKCSVFSLEMSASSLYYRMVAATSNIPMWQIRKGLIGTTSGTVARYLNAGNILSDLPIYIYDTEIDNDKVLYSKIRYEAKIKGSKVILIDHLGLIEVTDSSGQRYVDVGRITKTLHKMAKELHICIIVLAQCGREAEGKKPNLALLRESGNIEQDADVIMLLHRKREISENSNKDIVEELPTDVIVAKNRDGRTGTAMFNFQLSTMNFREDNNRFALDDNGDRSGSVVKEEKKQNEIPF